MIGVSVMDKNWCVYRHTFPDRRVYIGITSDEPQKRWNNGIGYRHHARLFHEIVCYGWYNIDHEILIEGLDEKAAKSEEKRLIQETPYHLLLNTIHATPPVTGAEKDEEMHKEFGRGDPLLLGARFAVHCETDWKDRYKRPDGLPPFSVKIYQHCVVLVYFCIKEDVLSTYEYRIDIPASVAKYSELREYLMQGVVGTWITEKHDPLPEGWQRQLAST